MLETLRANLLSPIPLAFALGVLTRVLRSEFVLPKDLYTSISIYLLFALGLKGGAELAHASIAAVAAPAGVTILLGILTPLSAYAVMRWVGRFSTADSAGMAAHYGSVSAVTFIAAQQFTVRVGHPSEGYMPTLLTLLESPGIHVALLLGALQRDAAHDQGIRALRGVLHEVFTGRTMILLVGGLCVGYLMGESGWTAVAPFFDAPFKGALMLFLLEMGIVAGARLGDLRKVGPFLIAYGIVVPLIHGTLGAVLGHLAGLSVGGATVLGSMAASASYIAAPPAVRLTLPEANPTLSLTAALAITFPFNLLFGIPFYYRIALAMS
ncbi:MAG: sodium-dependent bicarbonate transport family permease [Gemmatimonadaceae bacterium]|nr:sodium-dependent bicarbonate transport family permease [Gemmatimonadaceae bacterium]